MRGVALLTVVVLGLGGCASVITSNDKNVLIKHAPAGGENAVKLAETECQKHGKRATLDRMQCPSASCISQFRCE